jgi:hypothetical protein
MADTTQRNAVAERIGATIQAAITRLNLDYTKVGLAWGGKRQNVQHWVKGKHLPKASELPRLCTLLAIDANELLNVPPKSVLSDADIAAHRQWLIDMAVQAKPPKKRGVAPMRAQGKSRLRAV